MICTLEAPPQVRRWKLTTRQAEPVGSIATLFRKARKEGRAEGFALLPDGLSMIVVRRAPGGDLRAAAMSLRDANRLPDLIRDVVFGPDARIPGLRDSKDLAPAARGTGGEP